MRRHFLSFPSKSLEQTCTVNFHVARYACGAIRHWPYRGPRGSRGSARVLSCCHYISIHDAALSHSIDRWPVSWRLTFPEGILSCTYGYATVSSSKDVFFYMETLPKFVAGLMASRINVFATAFGNRRLSTKRVGVPLICNHNLIHPVQSKRVNHSNAHTYIYFNVQGVDYNEDHDPCHSRHLSHSPIYGMERSRLRVCRRLRPEFRRFISVLLGRRP